MKSINQICLLLLSLFLFASSVHASCEFLETLKKLPVDIDPKVSHYMRTKAFKILKVCNDGQRIESIRMINYASENLGKNVQFDKIENLRNKLKGQVTVLFNNDTEKKINIFPELYNISEREVFVDFDLVDSDLNARSSMISWIIFSTSLDAVRSKGIISINH